METDPTQRDDVHVEQHGDGDVNIGGEPEVAPEPAQEPEQGDGGEAQPEE